MMSPMSAEGNNSHINYIDWIVQVPWNSRSKVEKRLSESAGST